MDETTCEYSVWKSSNEGDIHARRSKTDLSESARLGFICKEYIFLAIIRLFPLCVLCHSRVLFTS